MLVWVNPVVYDKWLIRQVNIYGTGASSSSSSTVPPPPPAPTANTLATLDERRVASGTPWHSGLNQMLYNQACSTNSALCQNCWRKEQLGTLSCYFCGIPMTNIPVTAAHISAMVADRSQTLLMTLGLRVKEPQPDADPRRSRGIKREVFLGKSWGGAAKAGCMALRRRRKTRQETCSMLLLLQDGIKTRNSG